jgi:hypothetical protein
MRMRFALLLFVSALATSAATINYRDDGIFIAPSFSEGGVTVTGSSSLNFSSLNGIGVVGGLSDRLVDPASGLPEYLEFQAEGPLVFTRFSGRDSALGNVDGGAADSFYIEGFDNSGRSVGTYSYQSFGAAWFFDDFVSRLGVADVDRIRISAVGDSMLLQSIDVQFVVVPEPSSAILLLGGLASLLLIRGQGARVSGHVESTGDVSR